MGKGWLTDGEKDDDDDDVGGRGVFSDDDVVEEAKVSYWTRRFGKKSKKDIGVDGEEGEDDDGEG